MRRLLVAILIAVLIPVAVVGIVNLVSDSGDPNAALNVRRNSCC